VLEILANQAATAGAPAALSQPSSIDHGDLRGLVGMAFVGVWNRSLSPLRRFGRIYPGQQCAQATRKRSIQSEATM